MINMMFACEYPVFHKHLVYSSWYVLEGQ